MKGKAGIKQLIAIGLGVVVALISMRVIAQPQEPKITGKWFAEEMEESVIEIRKTDKGSFEGVIISSGKEDFVGQRVIYDFDYDDDENNYEGKIYSVARKMNLDGTIELISKDQLKITGRKFVMSKTFYWERSE